MGMQVTTGLRELMAFLLAVGERNVGDLGFLLLRSEGWQLLAPRAHTCLAERLARSKDHSSLQSHDPCSKCAPCWALGSRLNVCESICALSSIDSSCWRKRRVSPSGGGGGGRSTHPHSPAPPLVGLSLGQLAPMSSFCLFCWGGEVNPPL